MVDCSYCGLWYWLDLETCEKLYLGSEYLPLWGGGEGFLLVPSEQSAWFELGSLGGSCVGSGGYSWGLAVFVHGTLPPG